MTINWSAFLSNVISPFAKRGEKAGEYRNSVRESIHENALLSVPYVVMNALATIVASYGLLSNSSAVVIGAMIIALLLGPIAGIALALVDGDSQLLRRAFMAELVGAILVLGLSLFIGLIHRDIPITNELLARTHPNIMDLAIALAGGAAGAYATISPRISAGLVGVAVATALVPPLASCGILLAQGHANLAAGALLLFLVNLVAIQFASSAVLWLHGFHHVTVFRYDPDRKKRVFWQNAISLLLILTIVMALNFSHYLTRQNFETDVKRTLQNQLAAYPGAYLADIRFNTDVKEPSVTAIVRAPSFLTPVDVKKIEKALPPAEGKAPELRILSVIVKEASSETYLYDTSYNQPEKSGVNPLSSIANNEAATAAEEDEAKNLQIFSP